MKGYTGTKILFHDDTIACTYVFKQEGTKLTDQKHELYNYKDELVFKGTYHECVDYFNEHKEEVLHPSHPAIKK